MSDEKFILSGMSIVLGFLILVILSSEFITRGIQKECIDGNVYVIDGKLKLKTDAICVEK